MSSTSVLPSCVPEYSTSIDQCGKSTNQSKCYSWGWLGALILWFIIFIVLFWLIYYSLKPSFVLQTDSNQVDTAKVLAAAVITAVIIVFLIWLLKIVFNRFR